MFNQINATNWERIRRSRTRPIRISSVCKIEIQLHLAVWVVPKTEFCVLGTKCRAPFSHGWGGLSYHDALVSSVEPTESSEPPKVLFPFFPTAQPLNMFSGTYLRFLRLPCFSLTQLIDQSFLVSIFSVTSVISETTAGKQGLSKALAMNT